MLTKGSILPPRRPEWTPCPFAAQVGLSEKLTLHFVSWNRVGGAGGVHNLWLLTLMWPFRPFCLSLCDWTRFGTTDPQQTDTKPHNLLGQSAASRRSADSATPTPRTHTKLTYHRRSTHHSFRNGDPQISGELLNCVTRARNERRARAHPPAGPAQQFQLRLLSAVLQ